MHLREEEYDKAATDFFEVSKQDKEWYYNQLANTATTRPFFEFFYF